MKVLAQNEKVGANELPVDGVLRWGNGVLSLTFNVSSDGPVLLAGIAGRGMEQRTIEALPIVEILATNSGRTMNHQRLSDTQVGQRFRFVSAQAAQEGGTFRLEIVQWDEEDGIRVLSHFEIAAEASSLRTFVTLHAEKRFVAESISSLYLPVPIDEKKQDIEETTVYWADSAWSAENNWHSQKLRDGALTDIDTITNPRVPSNRMRLSSHSTWSTGEYLPMGIVETSTPAHSFSMMWQIENNGPWSWEIGEGLAGLHVLATGPTYDEHQWAAVLEAGQEFQTVPASMAVVSGNWQDAAVEMTRHRRNLVAQGHHRATQNEVGKESSTKVVYNDYMNTLFGDPTLEKERPLIEAAGKVGADVFCIDAGWYDSNDGGWWDSVGEWQPSTNRFGDSGLGGVIDLIREAGMESGLWLEPEVVGVKSPIARSLPSSAFFSRFGERVQDDGRYLLDMRSPEARRHLDETVDRLISQFGVKFFKFDDNSVPGPGSMTDSETPGEALLGHGRAYLEWFDALRARHPDVMFENCGSGAMRADYAMLSRFDLQSTSDQCNPSIYAAIAAGASLSVLPEQQGNWGYAQQEMDIETAAFTLAAGLLGRLYLSGFIDRMDDEHLRLVHEAIQLQRTVLGEQNDLVPWWPLGLPDFNSGWQAVGLHHDTGAAFDGYMTLWHRSGEKETVIEVPEGASITPVFPTTGVEPWTIRRIDATHVSVTASVERPSARVFMVSDRK